MARPASMIYMKHPEHGNAHFGEAEQSGKEAEGWVKWPRTAEQKAGAAIAPSAPIETQAEPVRRGPGRPKKQ